MRGSAGRWYTSKIPKQFCAGDTLFVWVGAPTLRVIGQAELTSPDDGFSGKYRLFTVKYVTNLIEGPTIADLREDSIVHGASFLKAGPAGTIFPLSEEQGARMIQLLAALNQMTGDDSQTVDGQHDRLSREGLNRLFGSAEINKQVEEAAVKEASRYYRDRGWKVKSVEAERCGYDLECRKQDQLICVEVKGTRSLGPGFVMTNGEYQKALSDPNLELCVVQSALSNPTIKTYRGGQIFLQFKFVPLAYKATSNT